MTQQVSPKSDPWKDLFQNTMDIVETVEKNLHHLYPILAPELSHKEGRASTLHSQIQPNDCHKEPMLPLAIFDPEIVQDTLNELQDKWLKTLQTNPNSYLALQTEHFAKMASLGQAMIRKIQGEETSSVISPEKNDKRFQHPKWEEDPFYDTLKQIYLLQTSFIKKSLKLVEGLNPNVYLKLKFYTNQLLSALAPTNFMLTNPQVMERFAQTNGENIRKGFQNFVDDLKEHGGHLRPKLSNINAFEIGRNLATTSGKVVCQNDLMQLIQYDPTTPSVGAIPLLIIPPWINKFYIFDLKPEKSFVKWALDSGLTVFILSWINPDHRHAHKTLESYMTEGVETAIDHIIKLLGIPSINTLGYCAGGIPLTCLMSLYGRKKINKINSASLVATPFDFSKMGDLLSYICETQVGKLKSYMKEKGYLDGYAMVDSFNMLRPSDLIWSSYIKHYLLGEDPQPFEFLFWNSDSTRMPATMMGEYLEKFFLHNEFINQKGLSLGKNLIKLKDIKTPTFLMAAMEDHICPWKSVFPASQIIPSIEKFILSGSGHVAGVFNHPQQNKYHFWQNPELKQSPDEWLEKATQVGGSWWPAWREWVSNYMGPTIKARQVDESQIIEDAPGSYVFVK